jgi:hypothetical protein
VLRLLPAEAVLSFSATSRVFRAWASSDALWEALCRRDWGAHAAAALAEPRREERGGAPWRRVYAEVARLSALSCARRAPARGAWQRAVAEGVRRGRQALSFLSASAPKKSEAQGNKQQALRTSFPNIKSHRKPMLHTKLKSGAK